MYLLILSIIYKVYYFILTLNKVIVIKLLLISFSLKVIKVTKVKFNSL